MKKTYINRNTEQIILDSLLKNPKLKDLIKEVVEEKKIVEIPVSVYHNKLSTLEASVKYLKESLGMKNNRISELLNRSQKTIWSAYERARKTRIKITASKIKIPVEVMAQRKFSILESLVSYLKDSHDLSFVNIAELLNLDPRTVWTVYSRYKKKTNEKQR